MKKIRILIGLVLLISCTNSIKGKIEYRKDNRTCEFKNDIIVDSFRVETEKDNDTKSAYLVNSSTDESYTFTIKVEQTTNDTLVTYNTKKIRLYPGDEAWLGCTKFYINPKKSKVEIKYSCTGQQLITAIRK